MKNKIIFSNMVMDINCFVYDDNYFFTNQKCFIITGKNLKYLISILNSKCFKFAYTDAFPTLGKEGRELSKIFFEKIPIPKISQENQKPFENLVNEILERKTNNQNISDLENQINKMVFALYGLTNEEIEFIEKY